jgi:hypothetical protein
MGKAVPVAGTGMGPGWDLDGTGMGPGPTFFPHRDRHQKRLVPFVSIYHI